MNIKVDNIEFSTQRILNSNVDGDDLNQVKSLHGAQNMKRLKDITTMIKLIDKMR